MTLTRGEDEEGDETDGSSEVGPLFPRLWGAAMLEDAALSQTLSGGWWLSTSVCCVAPVQATERHVRGRFNLGPTVHQRRGALELRQESALEAGWSGQKLL